MKKLKGFRGKYFSLAAILALNTTIAIASEGQSVLDTEKQLYAPKAESSSETSEVLEETRTPAVVISKKIKAQKSEVYTASKSLVSATNVTDNVSIITSEELSQKGISTVTEALNTISGISTTSQGGKGTLSSIFVQGMANKYTLLLVDGIRYNDPSNSSGADFSNLLVGDIERIEVIKGAQSGVWGADAAAGVINIITKSASKGTHGSAGVEIGSYGHKSFNTSLSHKTDTFDAIFSVQRVVEDGFSAQAPWRKDIDNYEDDSYRNTTINLKTGYWLNDSNRIEAGYHDINALSSYDGYLAPNSTQHSDLKQRSGYLTYKYFIANHAIETTLSKSTFERKELEASNSYDVKNYEAEVPSIEMKDTWKYYDNATLVFGGTYEKRNLDIEYVAQSKEELNENSKALYMNNTNKFGNVILTEALRYDKYSDFDDKTTGKVGVKYLFSNDFNIYTNYGTAYKIPNIWELMYSNGDLKPENIQSFNVGLQYAGLTINVFRNEIEDMISWDSATWNNKNIDGTSVLKGIEISYEQQLFHSLLAGANYTYVDAKDEDGDRLVNRPRYQTTVYATYLPIKQIAWNINGTHIGSREDSSSNETGNYFVANTKLTYHVNKDVDVYVKVNNLFDRYYQSVYGYASPERSYYAGVQAKF
ncbi:TonB-dependent receptor plug domain-containing protein [Sulfurospirillum deleyianum]|uniref:TonB-dependent receptor n=1 Tax=Sulfurospirillum deleyianum (strain ATCC 51133 / DSM 6946 / 5175) TaxID=525898 RepID=D1B307_SULD5|nr:TonB-dependent receptor [Sulfurospirillum deleyianum]ACZ12477.1 TonB-dependent receptor [Sulfurospirillum deleyianum DSM 6946]